MLLTDKRNSDRSIPVVPVGAPVEARANRYDVLSRLADDLAHEIKNPLNAMSINFHLLRQRVQKGDVADALARLDVIEHETTRVATLVDQLLQLLRPERHENSPVALDGAIEPLLLALKVQARDRKVTFEYELESSLYSNIRVVPLKFALLNLLARAIDAEAEAGGTVSIRARRAAKEIYIVVTCSRAVLGDDDDHIQQCKTLMESAGGALESLEPQNGGFGSTVTLVATPGRFA